MDRQGKDLQLGVIGAGHWGPNHVRVFSEQARARVLSCADLNPSRLERVRLRFPQVRTTVRYQEMLQDPAVDAVVIATPTVTHANLVGEALRAGKHVLVEKPLCRSLDEAAGLEALARATNRVLMVGHVYLHNDAVLALARLVSDGVLGRIHYLHSERTNLGPVRGDVNALYDLGSHDVSIFNYLLQTVPGEVSATGSCISQPAIDDVCFATLRYPAGTLAHVHASWLNPRKVRAMTVVGDRKMAFWDDVDPEDTLRVYDKGFEEPPNYDSFGAFQYLLRNADVHLPRIDRNEPLANQADAFVRAVLDGAAVLSGVREALATVAVLEAAAHSLRAGGAYCRVAALPRESPDKDESTDRFVVKHRTASISSPNLVIPGRAPREREAAVLEGT